MPHTRRIVAVLVLTLVGALGTASAALAGSTVGATDFSDVSCGDSFLWFDRDYAVASAGTITSFAYGTGPGTAGEAPAFAVVRPVGDDKYQVTGTSGTKTITSSAGVETFATDPIDVQAGDVLALWTGTRALEGCINPYGMSSAGVQGQPTAPQPGDVVADQFGGAYDYDNLNVSAHVTDPGDEALVVTTAGTGGGTVADDGEAIDCGTDKVGHADCTEDYPGGEEPASVTLTATADADSTFDGFTGGGCSGTDPCTVTVDQLRDVTATFSAEQAATVPVTVSLAGSGSGAVNDDPEGGGAISCFDDEDAQCQASYEPGTELTLYASPDEGSSFGGFSGVACEEDTPGREERNSTSEQQCTFTVGEDGDDVTATFNTGGSTTVPVSVTLAGSGSGTVGDTSEGGEVISCSDDEGADCEGSYEPGTQVALYALPDEGSTFAGFSGVTCEEDAPAEEMRSSTSEARCTFTVGEDGDDVMATFTSDESTLTVATTGTGRGYVDSDPSGIDCGRHVPTHTDCSEDYEPGTYVTLTAHPQTGTRFDGFDTLCNEDDDRGKAAPAGPRLTCTVRAGDVDTVTAKFTSTGGGSGGGGTFPPTTGDGGTTTGGGTQTGGGGTSTGGGQTPVVKRPAARVVRRRARPHRRLVLTCGSQACSATSTAVLRVRSKKIGSLDLGDAVEQDANAHTTIGLRITRALKAGIRHARRKHPGAKARLTVKVVFTQADGTTVTRRIRITIG